MVNSFDHLAQPVLVCQSFWTQCILKSDGSYFHLFHEKCTSSCLVWCRNWITKVRKRNEWWWKSHSLPTRSSQNFCWVLFTLISRSYLENAEFESSLHRYREVCRARCAVERHRQLTERRIIRHALWTKTSLHTPCQIPLWRGGGRGCITYTRTQQDKSLPEYLRSYTPWPTCVFKITFSVSTI
jgi:hypothetical protein